LQTRNWQDAATGAKRYRTEIILETLQMGPKTGDRMPASADPPAREQSPSAGQNAEPEIPIIEENDEIDIKNIPF
jgi:single-stranded DNA-binding protein